MINKTITIIIMNKYSLSQYFQSMSKVFPGNRIALKDTRTISL